MDDVQAALDELLLGAGVKEREQHTLADRGNYAVVTDPNTELLKQLLVEVRDMRHHIQRLEHGMGEIMRGNRPATIDAYEAILHYGRSMEDRYRGQPIPNPFVLTDIDPVTGQRRAVPFKMRDVNGG